MKVYFVARKDNYKFLLSEGARDLLFSFHYVKNWNLKEIIKSHSINVFLDSSQAVSGVKVNIDEYANFIINNEIRTYVNLDIIGDAELTLKNQRYLESKGLRPLPVFHCGEDWKYLKHYAKNYEYICIAGSKDNKQMEFWRKVFEVCRGKKIHALGVGSIRVLKSFPFYSTDIKNWFFSSVKGLVYFEDKTVDYKDELEMGNRKDKIRELGCDYKTMLAKDGDVERNRYNVRFFLNLKTERQKVRKIIHKYSLIPIEEIISPTTDIRKEHDLQELNESISKKGILQNLMVWKRKDGKFEVCGGNRRFLVAKDIGYEKVPCTILLNCHSTYDAKKYIMVENFNRKDPNDMELAEFLHKWKMEYEKKYPQAKRGGRHQVEGFAKFTSRQIHKSVRWVHNKLQLLNNNSKCTDFSLPPVAKFLKPKQQAQVRQYIEKHGRKNLDDAVALANRNVKLVNIDLEKSSPNIFIKGLTKAKDQIESTFQMTPILNEQEKRECIKILREIKGMVENKIELVIH